MFTSLHVQSKVKIESIAHHSPILDEKYQQKSEIYR